MDEDDLEQKLNAIVGKALQGLVMSGADAEFIGTFAASHRADVANLLGISQKAGLQAVSSEEVAAIAQEAADNAVRSAMEQMGLMAKRPASVRVNVKIHGRRTSVSIGQAIFKQAVELRGSAGAVNHIVRGLAEAVPTGTENNSAWIEERLQMTLNFRAADLASDTPRH